MKKIDKEKIKAIVIQSIMKALIGPITIILALIIGVTFWIAGASANGGSSSASGGGNGLYDVKEGTVSYESLDLKDSDREILYKIVCAERGGGTQQQQEYVASVILNRVLSADYPNNVHDVVFQENQFQPTRNGAYESANPSDTTKKAVDKVIKTGDKAKCAIGFMTPAAYYTQGWLQTALKDGSWVYLFNDEDESHNNASDEETHNFFTKKTVQTELAKYQSSGSSDSTVTGGTVVQNAVKIHKQVRTSGKYSYNNGSNKPVPVEPPYIDCSSYVSWVMYESGFKDFKGGQKTSSTFASNPWGWEVISKNNAKAGDILVYSGHVEIYTGKGNLVYNMGSNNAINSAGTSDLPESSDSGSSHGVANTIKILRPPTNN